MTADVLESLKNIDPALLTEVVRRDQHSPSFEITGWSVRKLSDKGVINPDGLWLFNGQGADGQGSRQWSVVLKYFRRPEQEPEPTFIWHWKRELLFARSGLAERMPGPVKAPSFYLAEETPEGARVWMEHVQDHRPGAWTLDEFSFAARMLGRWNGAYLSTDRLPDEPWLTRQLYRSWLGWVNPEASWQFALNLKYISSADRRRCDRLWDEREMFFGVLEGLPQVFTHCDSQRRNLFIRPGQGQADELVLVDWAQCGLAPLGAELTFLVGSSAMILEWPPPALPELDAAAFGSYMEGLREAGWSGNVDTVRLGYAAYVAVYLGGIFPALTAAWCSPESRGFALQIFGDAEEELFWKLLPLLYYTLDCADEARQLMHKLGVTA
jgi:hypothetical protein